MQNKKQVLYLQKFSLNHWFLLDFHYILISLLALFIAIFLHELGHFLTARKFGVRVEEFGFGLPPRIGGLVKEKGKWKIVGRAYKSDLETVYSLNWIPFGGFVKLFGEEGEHVQESGSFAGKPAGKRAIILTAGVAMNAVLTVLLLSIGFMTGTPAVIEDDLTPRATVKEARIQVVNVVAKSPAEDKGLKVGDTIISVNGETVTSVRAFQERTRSGEELRLIYERDNHIREVTIIPSILPEEPTRPIIGVGLIRTGIVSYPWYLAIPEGVRATGELAVSLLQGFGKIISDLITERKTDVGLAGPVGIAVLTGQVVSLGFLYILQFAATLSLNLAILNYLPFPALDGGRVLFILLEKLRGRAVDRKLESLIHTIGFALLLALIAFVTYKDIVRFGAGIVNTLRAALTS